MLNYRQYGEGPPVVILHGLFGMLDNWHSFAKRLSLDYHVITVDLRNHGRSFQHIEMDYDLMALDIINLMDMLNLSKASFIGHSMGGKTAIKLALDRPDLIERLIVLDILSMGYGVGHGHVFTALNLLDFSHKNDRKELLTALTEHLNGDLGTAQFLLKNLKRTPRGVYEWKFNLSSIQSSYDIIRGPIFGDAYHSPVLFIKGGDSNYIQEKDWLEQLELFPMAELEVIENAGHWLHVDQPEELESLVRDHLDG